MSEDLIKRSDAIKDLCDISNNSDMPEDWHRGMSVAISALYRVPPVPPTDRPQGEWLLKDNVFHCGCCGKESHFTADDVYVYDMPLPDFCEKCGARLKGADDE